MATEKQKSNVTMHDVAKGAKTSIATVSRVINDPDSVSKKLRQRVEKSMKNLNYHPNSLARSFKMQETRLIGLIIPLLDHPFFSRLAQIMEQELFRNDYRAIICNTEENEMLELEYMELLLRQRVDGVIVNSASGSTDYLFQLQSQNVPCVLIDRDVENFECSKVFSDNSQGGYHGMKYLLELGHRNIVVVAPFDNKQPMQHRLRGVYKALDEFDIERHDGMFIMRNDHSFEMGIEAGKCIADMETLPSAVFALTDVTAVGLLHGLNTMGLRVPDDISVMGYDGIPLSSYVLPNLTTVAQPIDDMGRTAVQLLIKHMEDPYIEPDRVVLPNKLIIRDSTMAKK